MTRAVKRRRGSTSEIALFRGLDGEVVVDLTKRTLVVCDGVVLAGYPLLREDLSNLANDAVVSAMIESLVWSKITGTPTTLLGYGITDAQPLDADLTAIALLTTTTYGRSLLTQANASAARSTLGSTAVGDALFVAATAAAARGTLGSTTVGDALFIASTAAIGRTALGSTTVGDAVFIAANAGAARSAIGAVIGTDVEAHDATLTAFAGWANGVNKIPYTTAADVFATLSLDTDGTLAANSDLVVATQRAVKAYADQLLAANDAMIYRGVIDCSANPNYPAANAGDTYVVSVAGKIGGASGTNVESNDRMLCKVDSTASGTQAGVGANWSIVQANLDGAVIGPTSATDNAIARYDTTTGKLLQNSGATIDDSGNLTATNVSGTNTGDQLIFKTITVAGQSDIVADSTADTLTIAAGTHIVITNNASTDTLTIATTGLGTADSPQFTGLELGHATDTTVTRLSSGLLAVEGIGVAMVTGAGAAKDAFMIAVSDETTALTTGTGKVTCRMPWAFTLTAIRASLTTAQTSGSVLTVNVKKNGTTILSTKLTFDNTEKTTTTAVTAPVLSTTSIADDDEITVDIDQVGDGTAAGLKVTLIGYKT